MLCITVIQLSADIILTVYSLYRAIGRSETVLFSNVMYKHFSLRPLVSDVNIEKIFAILPNTYKLILCITGIQLSADIMLTVYSLYGARKERDSVVYLFSNV